MRKGGSNYGDYTQFPEFDVDEAREKWFKILLYYSLITLQLLMALAVGVIVVSHSEIPQFVLHTDQGLAIYIICFILWFVVQCPILMNPHSLLNYPLFVLWSILFALVVGLSCSYSDGKGKAVLEGIILISTGSIFIILCALLGWILGCFFNLRGVSIVVILLVFCVYVIIQIVSPFADLLTSIYVFAAALGFCGNLSLVGEEMMKQPGVVSAVVKHYNGITDLMKRAQER